MQMAADGSKHNIAMRANMWQQQADKQYEKQPALAFSGRHYQNLGRHEVLKCFFFGLDAIA